MRSAGRWSGFTAAMLVLLLGTMCGVSPAQEGSSGKKAGAVKVVQVTGLPGVKNKTGGMLGIADGKLEFTHGTEKAEVPANLVSDVVTGNDSQRLIHGTLGTLTMFAPYESGRFMSLFRTKLDTLTIQYRDADGGLHGAVFTMGTGKAEKLKEQLLAQGAHTTVPVEDTGKSGAAAKGQQQ